MLKLFEVTGFKSFIEIINPQNVIWNIVKLSEIYQKSPDEILKTPGIIFRNKTKNSSLIIKPL